MTIDIQWMEENILLHKLKEENIKTVSELFTVHHYATGEDIVVQGEKRGVLRILRSGYACIACRENGRSIFLGEAGEGSLFGEMSFFSSESAVATVTAHSDCTVYALTREDYCTLMVKNHELIQSLLTHVVTHTSNVIKKMNHQHLLTHP